MTKITIRQGRPAELRRVIAVTRMAYRIPYISGARTTIPHVPKNIHFRFHNKEFFTIVAIINGRIVGAVKYKMLANNVLYIYQLAVLKSCRNRGLGAKMVKCVERLARRKGCHRITLDCAREKRLPDYYKHLGYRTDKIRKHLDHHDVYMSKRI